MPTTKNKAVLSVAAIKNGTVIDHITAGHALDIIRLLRLPAEHRQVTVGLNLPSKKMPLKDLVKVEGIELSKDDVNRVAILAPQATINIIKQYAVVKKFHVEVPDLIERLFPCPNPSCITNHESMTVSFMTIKAKKDLWLCCRYCEKKFSQEELIRRSNSI